MYIAAFYKAKLLRGVPENLQDDFEVFLRSLESVFVIDGDDIPATSTHQRDDRADPPPPSTASGDNDPTPHPFLVLRDRFSEAGLGEASATLDTVTSYVSAQMDGLTQVCSLRTVPLPFNFVLRCYEADDVRGVPYRARWRHAFARLNVHVDERSDDLNAFVLRVADDVIDRRGTHREHESR